MSLEQFQRALADVVASPRSFFPVGDGGVFAGYELTERERRRLLAMMADEGMAVNCTLYRVNRFVPLRSTLPLTLLHLGTLAEAELSAYWTEFADAELQYRTEATRFAGWLRRRCERGELPAGPYIDALGFELAAFAVLSGIPMDGGREVVLGDDGAGPLRGYLVMFDYEPGDVLDPPGPAGAPRRRTTPARVVVGRRGGELVVVHRFC